MPFTVMLFAIAIIFSAPTIYGAEAADSMEKLEKRLTQKEVEILARIQKAVVSDTTGLRKERKIVVPITTINALMKMMKTEFGERLESRVKLAPGIVGITETIYPQSFKFKTSGGVKKSAKIRIRHYIDENRATGKQTRSGFTKDKKFVEIKFEHFDHSKVLVKDRVRLPDAMVELILDFKSLVKNRTEIEKTARADQENDEASIGLLLDFLTEIQRNRNRGRLQPYLKTVYARESYKVPLRNKNGSPIVDLHGDPAQIEITIDRNTKIFAAGSLEPAYQYPANLAIAELKVPLVYGDLTANNLKEIPDLIIFAQALKLLEKNRSRDFPEDDGKFSALKKAKKNKKNLSAKK